MIRKTLLTSAAFLSAAGIASAQGTSLPSFNIDIGSLGYGAGVPSNTYAAAGPAAGTWTAVDTDPMGGLTTYVSPSLTDASGNPSAVTLEWDTFGGSFDTLLDFNFDEPNTTGDDQALFDDIGYANVPHEIRIVGLPAGTYDVITYAMAPDDPTFESSIGVTGSLDPVQNVVGDFASGFALGVTHAYHTVAISTGSPIAIQIDTVNTANSVNGIQIFGSNGGNVGIGMSYCGPAVVNSSGMDAKMTALGSPVIANNAVTLSCSQMPTQAFGFFLTSLAQGFVANPGGSQGNLCLGGAIGRYVGTGQIQNSGLAGEILLPIDLSQIPQPNGLVQAQAGQTWFFTTWFRDSVGGMATSNFSDGTAVTFQ